MEAVGAVANVLGIAVFLAETVKILRMNTARYIEHDRLIQHRSHALEDIHSDLQTWAKKWQLHKLVRRDLEERWGSKGANEIRKRLQLIDKDMYEIRRRFYGRDGRRTFSENESQQLEQLIVDKNKDRASRSGFMLRLLDAIYRDDEIRRRLDETTACVKSMCTRSDEYWIATQGLSIGTKITSDDIKVCLQLKHSMQECSSALSITYQFICKEKGSWVLLMPFRRDDPSCLLHDEMITIELLQAPDVSLDSVRGRALLPTGRTLKIEHVFKLDEQLDDVDLSQNMESSLTRCLRSSLEMAVPEQVSLKHNMRSLFDLIASQPEQRKRRRDCLLERSQAMIAIASWAVAAWSSDWINDLCNCVVRPVQIQADRPFSLAHRDKSKQMFCQRWNGCFLNEVRNRRHLVLGNVLAELALARIIRVFISDGEALCAVFNRAKTSDYRVITKAVLLKEIYLETKSKLLRDAVKNCFEYDRLENEDNRSFGHEESSELHSIRGSTIIRYEREVLPKLHQNYLVVAQQCKEYVEASKIFEANRLRMEQQGIDVG